MNEVRILILSPFTYIYGIKNNYFVCGDMFYLNPSSSSENLEELKFILDSYQKKGWVYIEEQIVKDYNNNSGVFSQKIDSTFIPEDFTTKVSESEEVVNNHIEVIKENTIDSKITRHQELVELNWQAIKKIANNLGFEYTDKEQTIIEILNKEFS